MHFNKEESKKRSPVVNRETRYAVVDKGGRRRDQVMQCDEMWVHTEEQVSDVSPSASNQIMQTIRKAVAFSRQPAIVDSINNMAGQTLWAPML